MAVLALYNFKGGTGKTASAANLAYISAREGHRTLLWDLDAQGSASFYFQVEERATGLEKKLIKGKRGLELAIRSTLWEGLHILPSDFSDRMCCNFQKAASERLVGSIRLRLMHPPRTAC